VRRTNRAQVEVEIDNWILHIAARRDMSDQARVAGLAFLEELASYAIRDPDFKRAKHPVPVHPDAPPLVREMARVCALAGVGPAFTFRGALLDRVGLALARDLKEVIVSCRGDHFVLTRKRSRLALPGSRNLAIVLRPELGPNGIHSAMARSREGAAGPDALVIVAESCMLADAGAAAASAIVAHPRSLKSALTFLESVPGIHGALLTQGDRVGLAGSVELVG
jgi:ApbE superfamily uncharacterized protein (UPF0280 family)